MSSVTELLDAAAEIVRNTDTPTDPDESRALDAAVHDVERALAELHDGLEVCVSPSDGWGFCSDCGARMERTPHKRGGNGCISGLLAPAAAVVAFVRRVRARLAPPTREDRQ